MKKMTLKEWRIKRGYTQKLAANKTDTTITYISLLENGHKNPSDKMKEKLAKLYKCSIEEIFLAIKLTNSKSKKEVRT